MAKDKNLVKFNEDKSKLAQDIFPNEQVIRKDGFHLVFPFLGTAGATAANYDQVFTAMRAMEIIAVSECHSVPSTSGTLQIEKLTGTTAPGAGSTILATTISTAGTANTVITRQGNLLTSARQLKPGDRLAFIDAGTLTNLVGLHVTIYCKYVGRGDYY
jgi:hypothetical protein